MGWLSKVISAHYFFLVLGFKVLYILTYSCSTFMFIIHCLNCITLHIISYNYPSIYMSITYLSIILHITIYVSKHNYLSILNYFHNLYYITHNQLSICLSSILLYILNLLPIYLSY